MAGRITDDTEQALALTDALDEADGSPSAQDYARHLFAWFERVGGANSLAVGPSTMQAMIAYGKRVSVTETGLNGVTNGAAMRITPIGVIGGLVNAALPELLEWILPACVVTHNTTPAIAGATAVAAAISAAIQGSGWDAIMDAAIAGAVLGATQGRWHYAPDLGRRIKFSRALIQTATSAAVGAGTPVAESVAAAIAIADFARGDPRLAIEIAGNTAGDADTMAAIAGSICGAFAGESALPSKWRTLVAETNQLDIPNWSARLQRLAAASKAKTS